jgi:hypothetical protein
MSAASAPIAPRRPPGPRGLPIVGTLFMARREIMFMPAKSDFIDHTSAFEQMERQLAPVSAAANKEEIGRPSLKITREDGCEPPTRRECKPGQPIESLCSAPAGSVNSL